MFGKKASDVLVVGAGPVGQFAALSLAKQGISTRVVDTGIWACSHSYGLTLHPESLELLDTVGLRETALESSVAVGRMSFWSGSEKKAEIVIGDPKDPNTQMAVLRQDSLEAILQKALQAAGGKVEWRREVVDIASNMNHAAVRINHLQRESRGYVVAHSEWMVQKTERMETKFVVGADGYESESRRSMGIEFPEVGPAEHFAVFEFATENEADPEVKVVLDEHGASVLWPLPGNRMRWSFQISDVAFRNPHRDKDRLLLTQGMRNHELLDDAHFEAYIQERAPWFQYQVANVIWRMLVRFERRMASQMGLHRVWLCGDSAHLAGPVGVQSMNVGLAEAADLTARVSRVLSEGAGLQDSVGHKELQDYEEHWVGEWRRLHGLTGGLRPEEGCSAWVASHAGEILSCLPAYGAKLTGLANQIGLTI